MNGNFLTKKENNIINPLIFVFFVFMGSIIKNGKNNVRKTQLGYIKYFTRI